MQVYTQWGEKRVATIKKDTEVRTKGGIKSPILREIKKGETVELPLPFAQVIENSMMAGRDAENFIEEKSSIE